MVTQRNHLFRKEALDQSASPEQLDQLIQVVSPKRWLSLVALGTLVTAGFAWSVLGRIAVTVDGRGMLVYPGRVVTVQAGSSGRILELKVKAGDVVEKGQVLATIDQSELKKQLQITRDKLSQLQLQDGSARTAQLQRINLDQEAIARQKQAVEENLRIARSLTPTLRERAVTSIQFERKALQERLKDLRELMGTDKARWDRLLAAYQEGAVSRDMVLQARQKYLETRSQLNSTETALKQLDLKETTAQQEYLRNVNQVNELEAQLKSLETKLATQVEQDLATNANRKNQIQETEQAIAQLELQLQKNGAIVSDYSGQVLEVSAKSGQWLEPGVSVGTITDQWYSQGSADGSQGRCAGAGRSPAASSSCEKLTSVVFVPMSEGKKIREGLTLQITPSNVKREEYGGIIGTVKSVSTYPVTEQGAAELVGTPNVLPEVMSQGAYVAVVAELQAGDTPSGYRWSSSSGPAQPISPGTPATVRIEVEEKAPIEYVLPFLKSLINP
jgi:HlyD family secretion protein